MSKNQVDFCAAITKDYFGPEVASVAEFLARNGSSVFRCLCSKGGFSENMLKKSLWVLIQHNFVDVTVTSGGLPVYKFNLNYVLQKTRHFKFMYMAKCLYGDEGKMIIEEISRHGKVDANDVVTSLSSQTGASRETLQDKWNLMKSDSLIVQCPALDSSELQQSTSAPHNIRITTNNNNLTTGTKAQKRRNVVESDEEADQNVQPACKKFKFEGLWKLNSSKFNEHLRNQIIIETMAMKIDRRSADIVKAILRLSELTQPQKNVALKFRTSTVTYNEIFACLKKQISLTSVQLDQMLKILLEDASSFVMKDGDSGGGVYKIDFQQAFTQLGLAHITSVIQEKYGSKSLRIFRVVMLKRKIEQKQIEDLVMMDPKETKELLYKLLEDNILSLTEVPRTADHAPQKTIYLFSVDLAAIARMLLHKSYKAAANLIHRRMHASLTNKRIIDKQKRLEIILTQIDADDVEQRKELEEQMTPAEKETVISHKQMQDMLEKSEIQLDETIFVLESFLSYC